MAKVLDNVRMYFTSATTDFTEESLVVEYRCYENDLSKRGRWLASGLDLSQTVSGLWDEVITVIKTNEGTI